MRKRKRNIITKLSDHDKKVLEDYTKIYTNYIESSILDPSSAVKKNSMNKG